MVEVSDTIERTVTFSAPIDRVWSAITEPAMIAQWFGDHAEFKRLAVGESILFGWGDLHFRGQIEAVEPPHRFSYRWEHRANPDVTFEQSPSTLVTFTLSQIPEGTRLTVLETGFASLPEHMRKDALAENTSGWDSELKDLQALLGQ